MYPGTNLRTDIARGLALVLLVVSLVSCNLINPFRSNSTPTPTSGSVAIAASNVSGLAKAGNYIIYASNLLSNQPIFPPNKAPVSAVVPGLSIGSTLGLQCPLRGKNGQSDDLVFKTGHLTYQKNEIQLIRNYLNKSTPPQYTRTPPPTLQWILGSTVCSIILDISNTGTAAVQISSLGVQITWAQPNSAPSFHTLDFCSVANVVCGKAPFYIGSRCPADITLTPTGSPSPATLTGSCSGTTLNPNDTFEVEMNLTSSAPYIYALVPVLTVTNSDGSPTTFTLSSMVGIAAFVNQQQITCFGLLHNQDTTFVPVSTIPARTSCLA